MSRLRGDICSHMDVKATFVNGNLSEEVYVAQPLGFEISGQEGMFIG